VSKSTRWFGQHMARHRCGYLEAYNAVLADGGPEVEAYGRRDEPGVSEVVRELTAAISKTCGELLVERAQAHMRQTGERNYNRAFDAVCADPVNAELVWAYDPGRLPKPTWVPWWREPPPRWRRRSA
jgi:hypothetical protein